MGVIEKFENQTVFIDTAPLIYFIEGNSRYQKILFELFKSNDEGLFKFQTSSLTLTELLVQPFRMKNTRLAEQYQQILTSAPNLDLFELDVPIAKTAARLRAEYNFKTPDALQLATSLEKNASLFFTNDRELKRIEEIEIVMLSDL